MVDLTQILSAVITLIAALISAFLIPYLKGKVSAEQMEKIQTWVTIAVQAAEMIYTESGKGEEKKAYVLKFLNSKGFTVDAEELENLIEAAVLELKVYTKETA